MSTPQEQAYQRAYREAHKEHLNAYRKAHYVANKEKEAARNNAYKEAHREKVAAYLAEYRKGWDAANKEKRAAYQAAYRAADLTKFSARRKVNNEVETGRFPAANTMVCDVCDEALAAHWHHHNGYAPEHALDVIAVCRECHKATHKEQR